MIREQIGLNGCSIIGFHFYNEVSGPQIKVALQLAGIDRHAVCIGHAEDYIYGAYLKKSKVATSIR